MNIKKGLLRIFVALLIPLMCVFVFFTYIDVKNSCEFIKINRLNTLMRELIDQDPVQSSLWSQKIGPQRIPSMYAEQESMISAANILPDVREKLFAQVRSEAENSGLCGDSRMRVFKLNVSLLAQVIGGMGALFVALFALIMGLKWVRDGFR